MLETELVRICRSLQHPDLYSLRSVLLYFYLCQSQSQRHPECDRIFAAFFKRPQDAHWTQAQVVGGQKSSQKSHILWPPVQFRPHQTSIEMVAVRSRFFIPVIPRFLDPGQLRTCLSLYGA